MIDLLQHGAMGDGVADNAAAFRSAIAAAAGSCGSVFVPPGRYRVSEPVELLPGVSLRGESLRHTVIDGSQTRNAKAVLQVSDSNQFSIERLTLIGNRKRDPATGIVTVTTDGISLSKCSYFDVTRVRVQDCKVGCDLSVVWCCKLVGVTALRCQEYGFQAKGTSTHFDGCTGQACGGGWKLHGLIYSTITCSAYDNGDAGRRPDDPFGSQGSGGNYQSPACVFYLAGSTVTINSPGVENSFSRYMYCEGSDVVVNNPTISHLHCYGKPWRFIELRGTATSRVQITNPRFGDVANKLEPAFDRCGLFVENAERQRLVFDQLPKIDESFGVYAYSKKGIYTATVQPVARETPPTP